jgi:LysR family transcriptional regulator, regulator for bpeEF and oprC
LPGFCVKHPGIQLDLWLSDRKLALSEDGIDVAVRVGAVQSETLSARRIGSQHLMLVAAPHYLARVTVREVEDLARVAPLAARFPSNGKLRPWLLTRDGVQREHSLEPLLTCDDGEALVAAALVGLGVCQVPDWLVREELASGKLVELLSHARPPAQPISLVHRSARRAPARVRALLDFLSALPALRGAG